MERLTEEKQIGPFAALKDKAEAVPGAFGTYDCLYSHMTAVTKLKQYEDTGLEPEEIIDLKQAWDMYGGEEGITAMLSPPPNTPLTLEELKSLEEGEPLWVEGIRLHGEYVLLLSNDGEVYRFVDTCEEILEAKEEDYGCEWTAYRKKPEEGFK